MRNVYVRAPTYTYTSTNAYIYTHARAPVYTELARNDCSWESVVKSNDTKEDKDIIGVESVNLINKYLFRVVMLWR